MELEVYFVDSFTSKVFGGNPAGVVFHENELTPDLMQKIAAENNLSETAFIHTTNNNRIKFFTPELEVDLCGHATLASAFTYFNYLNTAAHEIVFQANRSAIKAFRLAVALEDQNNYTEPPDWPHPMRLYLGSALLAANKFKEAEKVYRRDLDWNKNNGWSLFGLQQALQLQGKIEEAETIHKEFLLAWQRADVELYDSFMK